MLYAPPILSRWAALPAAAMITPKPLSRAFAAKEQANLACGGRHYMDLHFYTKLFSFVTQTFLKPGNRCHFPIISATFFAITQSPYFIDFHGKRLRRAEVAPSPYDSDFPLIGKRGPEGIRCISAI